MDKAIFTSEHARSLIYRREDVSHYRPVNALGVCLSYETSTVSVSPITTTAAPKLGPRSIASCVYKDPSAVSSVPERNFVASTAPASYLRVLALFSHCKKAPEGQTLNKFTASIAELRQEQMAQRCIMAAFLTLQILLASLGATGMPALDKNSAGTSSWITKHAGIRMEQNLGPRMMHREELDLGERAVRAPARDEGYKCYLCVTQRNLFSHACYDHCERCMADGKYPKNRRTYCGRAITNDIKKSTRGKSGKLRGWGPGCVTNSVKCAASASVNKIACGECAVLCALPPTGPYALTLAAMCGVATLAPPL